VKKRTKSTVSFSRLLIEHSQREYEPSSEHVLKRMLVPLCDHLQELVEEGAKNDAWDVIEGFARECRRLEQ